ALADVCRTESRPRPVADSGVEWNPDDGDVAAIDVFDPGQPSECRQAGISGYHATVDRPDRLLAHARHLVEPPFTWIVCPTNAPRSLRAKSATADAISSALPMRPIGMPRLYSSCISAKLTFALSASTWSCGVSITPGATALTVMFSGASSRPRVFVSAMSPAFEAE